MAKQAVASSAPTQSISVISRFIVAFCRSRSLGILNMPTNNIMKSKQAQPYQPTLQPTVSTNTPPSTSPIENPSGCPSPMHANATLRRLPLGTVLARIPTEVGRHSASAIPCMPRNMISSIPVRANPHPSTKQPVRKHPAR